MTIRRTALVLIAATLLIGVVAATCNGDGDDDGVPVGTGIEGKVTIGPMCPVIQQDTPCPDEPYQAEIVILNEDGDEVERFVSGEDGAFTININPGSYTIVPRQPNAGAPPFASEIDVEVVAGEYTHVDIVYDSGIR